MPIVFLGIALAKNVFALHGVDATGRRSVRRDRLLASPMNEAPMRGFALIRVGVNTSRSKDRLYFCSPHLVLPVSRWFCVRWSNFLTLLRRVSEESARRGFVDFAGMPL